MKLTFGSVPVCAWYRNSFSSLRWFALPSVPGAYRAKYVNGWWCCWKDLSGQYG